MPEENRKDTEKKDIVYGVVFGDIAGSKYEYFAWKEERKSLNFDNCITGGSY